MRKAVALVLFLPFFANAQNASQHIDGHVLDWQGSAIPHAAVTLRNTLNGTAQQTETTDGGEYTFNAVAPGEYVLTASANGLATAARSLQVKSGDGIHGLSEAECIAIADDTVAVFEYVFAKLRAEMTERNKFVERMKRLT